MEQEWQALGAISETLLLPLYARVIESRSLQPVLRDDQAEIVANQLFPFFSQSQRLLYRHLARGRLHPVTVRTLALRSRHFDRLTTTWLNVHPQGTVVTLGCGLDTRFNRIDQGQAHWIELDLPAVMALREKLFPPHPRVTRIACSVTDTNWVSAIPSGPVLFLAEGLFMYLPEDALKALLQTLNQTFPGEELICEVALRYWVQYFNWIIRYHMQHTFYLRHQVTFHSGLISAQELEDWAPGLRVVHEWSYFDEHREMGWLSIFRRFKPIRQLMWTLHCRLGKV